MSLILWTLPTSAYAAYQQKAIEEMKQALREAGAEVREGDQLACHFAVVDEELVWYGSMNFLSQEKEDDILMRLRSEVLARELLNMVAGEAAEPAT